MFGIPTVADMAAAAAAAAQSGSQQHQLMQHFYRLNASGTVYSILGERSRHT
jgi:hypothetical protein